MKQREILFVVISIFILVLVYIGFNIYHNAASSTISDTLSVQIVPINPGFDLKTIESLKKRTQISPDYQAPPQATSSPSSILPLPSPTPFSVGTATNAGQIKSP